MAVAPHAATEEIREDVACPRCQYNLRGLVGDVVRCPECGTRCDVARLVSRRWTQPWYRAPGFSRVLYPAVWVYVCVIVIGAVLRSSVAPFRPAWIAFLCCCPVVWLVLMCRSWRVFEDVRGVWLPVFGHLLLAGYLAGAVGTLWMGVLAVLTLIEGEMNGALVIVGGGLLFGLLFAICRRGERYIAGECIRRYLSRPPTS
jgi:hypothetical protein